jgi:hypothetical protein
VSPDQEGLIQLLPENLHDHVKQLQQFPDARRMFDDNWGVALVIDLRRLVSAQPSVRVDDAGDDVGHESDLRSVAHVTLPVQRPPAEVPAEFDPALQVWKITSKSPNIRITNNYGREFRDGFFTFGFVVEVLTPFLSVAQYRGRLVLRDGYHRAYRLISSGVFVAPAFLRAYADDESVFTKKTPAEQIWTGDRPRFWATSQMTSSRATFGFLTLTRRSTSAPHLRGCPWTQEQTGEGRPPRLASVGGHSSRHPETLARSRK